MASSRRNYQGLSITEMLIALAITSAFLLTFINGTIYSAQVGAEQRALGKLRQDVEIAAELIKHDTHLSNTNGILFYPANASCYTAISLPQSVPDADGFLTFSSSLISWGRTVIYHLYTHDGKTDLRKTTFSSFQSDSTTRQTQLDNVVANGDGSAGPGGAYTTTTIFSSDTISLAITPPRATFDGYAAQTEISEPVSFGSLVLSAGNHAISFIVTGANAASTGYGIGVDYIALSTSISGGSGKREAEALLPATTSSGTTTTEYLNSPWSGNAHVQYLAPGVDSYVTFTTYYDMWMESNFDKFTHSDTAVYGSNPCLSVASREDQSLHPAWKAQVQTDDTIGGANYIIASSKTYRCVASGSKIQRNGDMIRVMFSAGDSGSLTISSAYFGVRSLSTGNFSAAPTRLYFDNGSGEPAVGSIANPGVNVGITIPAGSFAWTNWFTYTLASPSANDFLISFCAAGSATSWTDPASSTQSYAVDGDHAADMTLSGPTTSSQTIAAEQIAGWAASGTATSPIFDTKLAAPVYNQLVWTPTLPGTSTVHFKVRSSASSDMSGAADWASVSAITATPGSLSGTVSNLRYLQYQAIFQTAAPYTAAYPTVDDVKIDWPGQTALVEMSGVFTKKPNYGVFKVQVDGTDPVKVLECELSASSVVHGKTLSCVMKLEELPANTGK